MAPTFVVTTRTKTNTESLNPSAPGTPTEATQFNITLALQVPGPGNSFYPGGVVSFVTDTPDEYPVGAKFTLSAIPA